MTTSKFDIFITKDFVYKTVSGHDLETTVCVPKNASSGKHPVLVHLHGGFLIVGDKMFEPWFATWLIQFAETKGAIIVSPNYRLLPEATGQDILEDLTSFYAWVAKSLPSEVSKISNGVETDLSQILVAGESAGGYLATQSAIHFPQLKFKAIISQYGMLDMEHPHFSQAYQKEMSGAPHLPVGVVDDYKKGLQPDAVRSSTIPPGLWSFIVETVREGRILDFLGKDKTLFPMRLLNETKELPPFWIIHGETDDFVPIDISTNFVNKMEETHPNTPVFYTVNPGPHGFDADNVLTDDFVKEGTQFIEKYWP